MNRTYSCLETHNQNTISGISNFVLSNTVCHYTGVTNADTLFLYVTDLSAQKCFHWQEILPVSSQIDQSEILKKEIFLPIQRILTLYSLLFHILEMH